MNMALVRSRSTGLAVVAVFVVLALLHESLEGQSVVKNVAAGSVQATVTPSGSHRIYQYTITNGSASTAGIWRIWLDLKSSNGAPLSSAGLVNGQCFQTAVAAVVQGSPAAEPMTPAALAGPGSWRCGLALGGTAQWFARDQISEVAPGQTMRGYTATSPGLPGIRAMTLEPLTDVDALNIQPPEDDSPAETKAYIAKVTRFRTAASFHVNTVGPTTPPADFKAAAFLQTIIGYKEEAIRQGWIKNQGIGISLNAKLNAANAALTLGENKTAVNILTALIHEVDAQAGKQLSSEAVALLKFNTQYLIGKIQN